MAQGIVYIREQLPYWLSCNVRAHKFHLKNLVFKDHYLFDQLEALRDNNRALLDGVKYAANCNS